MDGSEIANKAKKLADDKRAAEKAAWEKKLAGIEASRAKAQAARIDLNQMMADFVASVSGMRWDPEGGHLYVGQCKVAQVSVYCCDGTLHGLQWCIDVYPQWPKHDRDVEIKANSLQEFADVFTQFVSRFF